MKNLQILSDNLIESFEEKVKPSVKKCFQELDSKEFTVGDFKNYMIAGAVASSQIEGSGFYQKRSVTNQ